MVTTNKIEPKNVNYNHHCNYPPTTPRIGVGQVRIVAVVMVLISAPVPYDPSEIGPKKVNYNHKPPRR
jgi:hypothetical protein